ncbi:HisA/HisF-related TIM barrel protein [Pajaroellobacter abortibovis]
MPFCVACGIRMVQEAEQILTHGADKISINSPSLERASLIEELVE